MIYGFQHIAELCPGRRRERGRRGWQGCNPRVQARGILLKIGHREEEENGKLRKKDRWKYRWVSKQGQGMLRTGEIKKMFGIAVSGYGMQCSTVFGIVASDYGHAVFHCIWNCIKWSRTCGGPLYLELLQVIMDRQCSSVFGNVVSDCGHAVSHCIWYCKWSWTCGVPRYLELLCLRTCGVSLYL
jgi:hypothetical protein